MIRRLVISGLAASLAASPAAADIYCWESEPKVRHCTDSLEEIPEEHRAEARLVAREWERPPIPVEAVERPREAETTAPKASSAESLDEGDVEEAWERGYEEGRRATEAPAPATSLVDNRIQTNVQQIEIVEAAEPAPRFFPAFFPVPVVRRPDPPARPEPDRLVDPKSFRPHWGPPPLRAYGPSPGVAR